MNRPRPLRDLTLAATLLTVLPLPVAWPGDAEERPDVAGWFPLVGAGLGAVVAFGLGWLRPKGPLEALLLAAVMLAAVAVLTRGLHLDGLADVFDGLGARGDRERRLDVMRDSHVGAFGAVAVVLVLGMQAAALGAALLRGGLVFLLVAFCAGRLAATFSAWIGVPARTGGLGASVCRRPSVVGVAATVLALAMVAWLAVGATGRLAVVPLVGSLVAALVVPDVVARPFGGVTGDTMGASVILTETFSLVIAVIALGGF